MSNPQELTVLAERIADVVASPCSDFYRKLYNVPAGSKPILASWDDWSLVPTFTKESLLERNVREYTFVPHKDAEVIYYTSGTSGKPPVFCPRAVYTDGHEYRKQFYNFKETLLSSVKDQHRSDAFLAGIGSQAYTVAYDGKNIGACIALAKAAGVTSLSVHTFTIQRIGEEMKKAGIAQNIRLINFVGETCSLQLYSYMRETFPNATIVSFFGMTEVDGAVGIPCRPLSDTEPFQILHVHPQFHMDIIDPNTGKALHPTKGVEGEVLVTDLNPHRAMPLVRYRPGDMVRVVDTACKEHGTYTFTVLGKTASDFMLVPGGQLRADEIERVLRTMPKEVTDIFTLHRYDSGTKEHPMLEVVLHVQTLLPGADLAALALRIQQELRVAPNRTYQQNVAEGYYLPLRCVPLKQDDPTKKHRRMFKH